MNRRALLVLPFAALTLACESSTGGSSCPEPKPGSLTPEQKKLRIGVGYQHVASDKARLCSDCMYFKAAKPCGSCEVMPGPTNPGGSCQLFRPAS